MVNVSQFTQFNSSLNSSQLTQFNSSYGCLLEENVDEATFHDLNFLVEGVLSSIVATIGISGNLASIFVLIRPKFKETFHKLLICLSIVDSVFILCASCSSWIRITKPLKQDEDGEIVKGNDLHMIFLYCIAIGNWARVTSLLVTISISIERYFGICFPLQSRVRGRRRVAVYLLPTLLFSFAFNFPKFLEITPAGDFNIELSKNPFYSKVYKQYVEIFVTVLAPLLLLLALNFRIIYAIRYQTLRTPSTSSERREQYLTYLLVSIVAVFLFCHSLKFFLVFYKELDVARTLRNMECELQGGRARYPTWMFIVSPISHLLLVLNSSLNFLIYCFVGARFRIQFRRALGSCCTRRESAELLETRFTRADTMEMSQVRYCTKRGRRSRCRVNQEMALLHKELDNVIIPSYEEQNT